MPGPLVDIARSNTILYCRAWDPTVRFYRDGLALPVVHANEWFVEFLVAEASYLSIADASRATIDDVGGQGVTLSWRVADLDATRAHLLDRGLEPSEIHDVWNARACHLVDPKGHRIELWAGRSG
jgi:catechol 2,3-dioxygenase-like lactoylglutathione lyase family enzyme